MKVGEKGDLGVQVHWSLESFSHVLIYKKEDIYLRLQEGILQGIWGESFSQSVISGTWSEMFVECDKITMFKRHFNRCLEDRDLIYRWANNLAWSWWDGPIFVPCNVDWSFISLLWMNKFPSYFSELHCNCISKVFSWYNAPRFFTICWVKNMFFLPVLMIDVIYYFCLLNEFSVTLVGKQVSVLPRLIYKFLARACNTNWHWELSGYDTAWKTQSWYPTMPNEKSELNKSKHSWPGSKETNSLCVHFFQEVMSFLHRLIELSRRSLMTIGQ